MFSFVHSPKASLVSSQTLILINLKIALYILINMKIKSYSLENSGASSDLVIMAMAALRISSLWSIDLFQWACKAKHSAVCLLHQLFVYKNKLTTKSSPS